MGVELLCVLKVLIFIHLHVRAHLYSLWSQELLERKQYLRLFPVVISESLAHFNLAFRITGGGFLEVPLVTILNLAPWWIYGSSVSVCALFSSNCSCLTNMYLSFFFSPSQKTFQLQDEAVLTLSCIGKCKDGGFEELFMTKIDYPAKYDYCMRYSFFIWCLV